MKTSLLKWSTISYLGQSKIVKSSYVWFFIIPIIAKIIPSINLSIIDIKLPFTWQALYYASIFFVIANLSYIFSCPDFIKKFKNFYEYKNSKISDDYLMLQLVEVIKPINEPKKLKDFIDEISQYFDNLIPKDLIDKENGKQSLISRISNSTIKQDKKADLFFYLQKNLNQANNKALTNTALLYVGGFLFILYILIENFLSVIKYPLC